ncbi:hypothetical protein [Desulfocastanea catecholica]
MKKTYLFFAALLVFSTWAYAEEIPLSTPAQERVHQLTREMNIQGIPEAQAQRMFTLMHQQRYQERNIVRAQQTLQNAAQEDLPTEPLMNKAMEGMAKQVPEDQVIAAMERVRDRYSYSYRQARSLSADRKTMEPVAEAIADSLAAGMTNEEMDVIMTQLQVRTRQQTRNQAEDLSLQTMQTVRSMVRLGATSTDVSDTVSQALQNRYTARNMEQLRHSFADEAQRTGPSRAAHQNAQSFGRANDSGGKGSGGSGSGGSGSGGSHSGGSGSGGSGSGGSDSGGSGSGGSGSGGSDSGGSGSGGSGSGGSGSGGSGSGGSDSGGSDSGGSDSGGSGSGGSDSGGSGSGGSGSGGSGSGGSDGGGSGSGGSGSGGGGK